VIGRSGAGYNNFDITAATARKIPVVYTPGDHSKQIAEAALALILAVCRKIEFWDQQLKRGNWKSRNETNPGDLEGTTLGLIGFGSIGQNLAQLVIAFNVKLLAYDPYVSADRARQLNVELLSLDDLIGQSAIISTMSR